MTDISTEKCEWVRHEFWEEYSVLFQLTSMGKKIASHLTEHILFSTRKRNKGDMIEDEKLFHLSESK